MDKQAPFVQALMVVVSLAATSSPAVTAQPFGDLTEALVEHRVPLASVVVTIDEATHSATYRRRGGPVAADDYGPDRAPVFEAASLGKVVTAYLVHRLVDAGALSLDEPVAPYLGPEWTEHQDVDEITLRMLLSHSAGYGNGVVPLDRTVYDEPGARFRYSGVGYVAVMHVLEQRTGRRFQSLAEEQVFTPLGMSSSSFVTSRALLSRKVAPHVSARTALAVVAIPAAALLALGFLGTFAVARIMRRRGMVRSLRTPLAIGAALLQTVLFLILAPRFLPIHAAVWGATLACAVATRHIFEKGWIGTVVVAASVAFVVLLAGDTQVPLRPDAIRQPNAAYTFHTTGDDLAGFAQAVMQDFHEPYLRPMFTPQVAVDNHIAWAAGLGIEQRDGRTLYWHWGSNMGFKSLLVIDPAQRTASVVLTNSDNGLAVAHQIAGQVHGSAFRLRLPE